MALCKIVFIDFVVDHVSQHALSSLNIMYMEFNDHNVVFHLLNPGKTDSPSLMHNNISLDTRVLELFLYPMDQRLCPVNCLILYLSNTKYIRAPDITELFLSSIPPFNAVKKATFCGWVKKGLTEAGIDLSAFTLHSTRESSSSTAFHQAAKISEILFRAGWKSVSTFMKYYARQIQPSQGVCVEDICFFGTSRGWNFLLKLYPAECNSMVQELVKRVHDQNPLRKNCGDTTMFFDNMPNRFSLTSDRIQ